MDKELIQTIRLKKWKTWIHIYKEWEYYSIYVFNLVCDERLWFLFDSIKWARRYARGLKKRVLDNNK